MSDFLRELKARKAKFGFACDYISLKTIPPLGKFIEEAQGLYDPNSFIMELTGMSKNEFRFYTDDEDIANWVRNNFLHTTT